MNDTKLQQATQLRRDHCGEMSTSPFASEIKKAKVLEARLENKIQRYSVLAQKINADLLCDEENPLVESNDEKVPDILHTTYTMLTYSSFSRNYLATSIEI